MRKKLRSDGINRSQRHARRVRHIVFACLAPVIAAVISGVYALAPKEASKPLVTVYASAGCEECERWIEYLNRHGFRAVEGPADLRDHLRRELRLPASFQSPAVAGVNGLYVSGFVPAREIHKLLRGELGKKVLGVAVRHGSVLPWKPVAMASQGLTVFAVIPGGMLRPAKVYHGSVERPWGGD